MSVTFNLYKVNNSVDFEGNAFEELNATKNIMEMADLDIIKALVPADEISPDWASLEDMDIDIFNKYTDDKFSDGKEHKVFNLSTVKALGDTGDKRTIKFARLIRNIKKRFNIKHYRYKYGKEISYVTVDTVAYNQGWYIKRSWFNRSCTADIRITKRGMNDWFSKYIKHRSLDPRAQTIINQFNEAWTDDGEYIFTVIW